MDNGGYAKKNAASEDNIVQTEFQFSWLPLIEFTDIRLDTGVAWYISQKILLSR